MRSVFFAALVLLSSASSAAEPVATPSCELQAPGMDSRKLQCTWPAPSSSKRYRLQVNFSGGHDDTKASMLPTLNGAPLRCETGSKTQLMGEDGDVHLACIFSVEPGRATTFGATFTWSHAEYVDYAITAH